MVGYQAQEDDSEQYEAKAQRLTETLRQQRAPKLRNWTPPLLLT